MFNAKERQGKAQHTKRLLPGTRSMSFLVWQMKLDVETYRQVRTQEKLRLTEPKREKTVSATVPAA